MPSEGLFSSRVLVASCSRPFSCFTTLFDESFSEICMEVPSKTTPLCNGKIFNYNYIMNRDVKKAQ